MIQPGPARSQIRSGARSAGPVRFGPVRSVQRKSLYGTTGYGTVRARYGVVQPVPTACYSSHAALRYGTVSRGTARRGTLLTARSHYGALCGVCQVPGVDALRYSTSSSMYLWYLWAREKKQNTHTISVTAVEKAWNIFTRLGQIADRSSTPTSLTI